MSTSQRLRKNPLSPNCAGNIAMALSAPATYDDDPLLQFQRWFAEAERGQSAGLQRHGLGDRSGLVFPLHESFC